jgi:hypothetical protein
MVDDGGSSLCTISLLTNLLLILTRENIVTPRKEKVIEH